MHVLALAVALCNSRPIYRLVSHRAVVAIRHEEHGFFRAEERIRFSATGPAAPIATHAGGHRLIAMRYARESGGRVSGMGSSPALARRALARAIQVFERESQRELEREQQSYDRVTDDGKAQERGKAFGYPAAPNTDGACRG